MQALCQKKVKVVNWVKEKKIIMKLANNKKGYKKRKNKKPLK